VGAGETYSFFGHYYSDAQAASDFLAMSKALAADLKAAGYPSTYAMNTAAGRALDQLSLYDWIETRVPGGHSSPLGALLDVAYNIEYGAETTDQSSLNLVYLLGYQPTSSGLVLFGQSDERFHTRGGNQQIPEAVAAALPVPVQTGYRLIAVAQNSTTGEVNLVFQVGNKTQTVTVDRAVLAVPFTILRTIDLSNAGFDTRKLLAINTLGGSRNGKLQLQFNQRIWNSQGPWGISNGTSYTDTGIQAGWDVSLAQPGNSGILVDYTGGNVTGGLQTGVAFATDTNKDVRTDANWFLDRSQNLFPGLRAQWNGKVTSSIPHLYENFKLAYSYWKVGQYQTIAGYEKVRQGNVLFAGEHCSQDYQGFMEGGAEEGQRAAGEILEEMGIHVATGITG
jgi:monoamine oxidase